MATIDPSEMLNEEGWPEKVYDPTYPHEFYSDLGKRQPEPDPDERLPITIRRHSPGSTDPIQHEVTKQYVPSTPNVRFTSPKQSRRTNTFTLPTRNQPSTKITPDDRPIKPMKDTSIYYQSLSAATVSQRSTPRRETLKLPKIKNKSIPFDSDSFQLASSSRQNNSTTPRRPIFADVYAKQPYYVSQKKRDRSRPLIVEEYVYDYDDNNDDDNDGFLPAYIPTPTKIVSYKPVSGMTTRERENYLMSRNQPSIPAHQTPIRRIIYPH